MTRSRIALLALALGLGCHHAAKPPPPPPPPPPPSGPPMNMVTSMVVVEACPNSKQLSTKLATKEIEELVGPCTKVPGGAAHFSATLLPDGRVELASPSGDPSEGIVPTCLVQTQQQLHHKLRLTKPCRFDVKLEQRTT